MTNAAGWCSTPRHQRHRLSFTWTGFEDGEPARAAECLSCLILRAGERTMDNKQLIRISKYLSLHLRHQPERIGLELEDGGWIDVGTLLSACADDGFSLTRAEL